MRSSTLHKVCFPIDGRPAINRALDVYKSCGIPHHIIVVGTMAALFVFVISKALLIQRKTPVIGTGSFAGMTGRAKSSLNPEGTVFVNGEYWKARSLEEERIAPGEEVTVVRMEGRMLLVRHAHKHGSSRQEKNFTGQVT